MFLLIVLSLNIIEILNFIEISLIYLHVFFILNPRIHYSCRSSVFSDLGVDSLQQKISANTLSTG